MLGEKGVHWEFLDKTANSGATKFLPPYQDFNKKLNEVGVRDMSESAFCPIWLESVYKNYIDPLAVEYASINTQYWDPLLGINLPSSSQYQTDLDNLTKSAYLDIITGRKPLDSFDSYVKTWKEKGGDILTKEANDAYQKMFK